VVHKHLSLAQSPAKEATKPERALAPPAAHEPGVQKPSIRSANKNAVIFFSITCLFHFLRTMESLSETQWDVVISGTGLQQSLLAL
jgi:hypothetical protein